MRTAHLWLVALVAGGATVTTEVGAQPIGVDPNRDCQTLVTCRFTSGGVYRGCLSSYSCRVCSLVASRCRIDSDRQVCRRMRCTWS